MATICLQRGAPNHSNKRSVFARTDEFDYGAVDAVRRRHAQFGQGHAHAKGGRCGEQALEQALRVYLKQPVGFFEADFYDQAHDDVIVDDFTFGVALGQRAHWKFEVHVDDEILRDGAFGGGGAHVGAEANGLEA